jgi:hypothetical protein
MNEIEQLQTVKASETFWQNDDCHSFAITGGMSVGVARIADAWTWKVKWADGTEESASAFRTLKDAKNDLREFLDSALRQKAYLASSPAEVTF